MDSPILLAFLLNQLNIFSYWCLEHMYAKTLLPRPS